MPATPARDLVRRAEEALPELRPEPAAAPSAPEVADLPVPEPDDDLLVLTAEDLWPEEAEPVLPEPDFAAPVHSDVHLELEELDLDSLQDLTSEALPPVVPAFEDQPEPVLPDFDPAAVLADDDALVTLSGLEELEALPADFQMTLPEPEPVPAVEMVEDDDAFAGLPDAASLIGGMGVAAAAGLVVHEIAAPEVPEPAPANPEPALVAPVEAEGLPQVVRCLPFLVRWSRVPRCPSPPSRRRPWCRPFWPTRCWWMPWSRPWWPAWVIRCFGRSPGKSCRIWREDCNIRRMKRSVPLFPRLSTRFPS